MSGNSRTILGPPGSAAFDPEKASRPGIQTVYLRRLWWAAILLLGISASAVGWTIWQLRTDAINSAIAELGNIATILAGQLSRSAQSIDAVLLEINRSVEAADIEKPDGFQAWFGSHAFHELLTAYRARLPYAFNIAMADKDGQIRASTAAWPTPKINVADRDYFKDARDRADDHLITSVPVENRVDGNRTIVFARRLQNTSGSFAGVIFASVNTKYFEDTYGAVQSVQSLLFTLLRSDGTILVRYPQGQNFAGRRLTSEASRLQAWAKDGGGFRVRAQTDGNIRYVSVRATPGYPLFVNISVAESTVLAGWCKRAAIVGTGSAVLLACSIYFLIAATRQVRRLSKSEASLVQKSQQLTHMARYDALTGLANRARFMERANEAVARMRDHGESFSILMLDLDRFKNVNDLLGHSVGDSLLKIVAERLREITPDVDKVARFGGDEFAVLYQADVPQKDAAVELACKIIAALTEPYELDGRKITIGTSVGITSAPRDGSDTDGLLKNADLALYKAKSAGGNRYCSFQASMETAARERRELEDDLRRAIARNEFELRYQTMYDIGSQECCGAEALVRWRHPKRGLIAPDQFIALAEESGLIVRLGEWILRQACADAVKWPPHIKLAVNFSPAQFNQGDLLALLTSTLADTKLPAKRLELEITETLFLDGSEQNARAAASDQEPGRVHRARRLRDRIFLHEISADVPDRSDQDRQVVHPKHGQPARLRRHRLRDRRAWTNAGHRNHGGRGRDAGAIRAPAQRRLQLGARISVQPSGSGIRAHVRAPGGTASGHHGGLRPRLHARPSLAAIAGPYLPDGEKPRHAGRAETQGDQT